MKIALQRAGLIWLCLLIILSLPLFHAQAQAYSATYASNHTILLHKPSTGTTLPISPNAVKIGKALRGGLLSTAIALLFEATDRLFAYARDYTLSLADKNTVPEEYRKMGYCYTSGEFIGSYQSVLAQELARRQTPEIYKIKNLQSTKVALVNFIGAKSRNRYTTFTVTCNFPQGEPDPQYSAAIATQIIQLAAEGNTRAQALLVDLVLAQARAGEYDQAFAEAERETETTQYDASNCPSGIIREEYNQCWICEPEMHAPIHKRVEVAKGRAGSVGGCTKKELKTKEEFLIRISRWSELAAARDAENRCWTPPHAGHIKRALDDHEVVAICKREMEKKFGGQK